MEEFVVVIDGDRTEKGKVVGCDYDIGITIVGRNDHDLHLFCIAGPSSTLWGVLYSANKNVYDKLYTRTVEQIKKGAVNVDELHQLCIESLGIGRSGGRLATAEVCPFGQ